VDLLPSKDGAVFVLEVNAIPGWRALQQATGLDVAGAVVDHLVQKVAAIEAARPSTSLRAGEGVPAELPA
jgi:ribosomal protein S6--L-glutamate ligase